MDKLILEKVNYQYQEGLEAEAVEIYINGKKLTDILYEYECMRNEENEHVFAPVSARYLYDELTKYYKETPNNTATILGCRCGEPQCDPLYVSIKVGKNFVEWIVLDWSTDKEYSVYLESFTFEKKQYDDELGKLKNYMR